MPLIPTSTTAMRLAKRRCSQMKTSSTNTTHHTFFSPSSRDLPSAKSSRNGIPFTLPILLLIFIFAPLSRPVAAAPGDPVVIRTPAGPTITGITNALGNAEFLGIEYATANRWEPPKRLPVTNTSSNTVANAFRESCAQNCQTLSICAERVSEKCLFLNVWTPTNATVLQSIDPTRPANATQLRPVMIVIHGGGFNIGSGSVAALGATNLAVDLNAVVVTFNYRLTVFGFFDIDAFNMEGSTNTSATMNFGILDQRLAIEWVLENAVSFGGDPKRVTLYGWSAGALSAIYHMANPPLALRINNVILSSPPAVGLRSKKQAEEASLQLAKDLGCTGTNARSCMLQAPMRQILNVAAKSDNTALPKDLFILPPIIDGVDVPGTFPDILLQRAPGTNGPSKPVMVGSSSNETYLLVQRATRGGKLNTPNFQVFSNAIFKAKAQRVRERYNWWDGGFLADRRPTLTRITSDSLFVCPLRKTVLHNQPSSGIYTYTVEAAFTGTQSDSLGDLCDGYACHGTDLSFLFQNASDPRLLELSTVFRAYVARFLWNSDPNIPINATNSTTSSFSQPASLPVWPAASSPSTLTQMRFPDPLKSADIAKPSPAIPDNTDPLRDYCNFWDETGYLTQGRYGNKIESSLRVWVLALFWSVCGGFALFQVGLYVIMSRRAGRMLKMRSLSAGNTADWRAGEKEKENATAAVGTGVDVEVRNLSYNANDRPDGKELLSDISFTARAGTVNAIMGASGSGKTTLLSLMARMLPSVEASEKVFFLGHKLQELSTNELQKLAVYVGPDERDFEGLTPWEVLVAASMMGESRSDVERRAAIDRVLDVFSLHDFAHVVIQEKGSISTGQRRKLALAVCFLRNPKVLFLDEPTSGLDSKSASDIMDLLLGLATSQDKTIICSIHQPRIEIYRKFTQILVIDHGRMIHCGSPEQTLRFFKRASQMHGFQIPQTTNAADLILDIASMIPALARPGSEELRVGVDQTKQAGQPQPHPQVQRLQQEDREMKYGVEIQNMNLTVPSLARSTSTLTAVNTDIGTSSSGSFSPPASESTGSGSIQTDSGRASVLKTAAALNYRWWITRPLNRKLGMLFIGSIVFAPIAVASRRFSPSVDEITLGMVVKALFMVFFYLSAVKNISISFDYYADLDFFAVDFRHGRALPIAFFIHRFIYDVTLGFLESALVGISVYLIVGADLEIQRMFTVVTVFILHYQTICALFLTIYSMRISRPETRSVTLVLQALLFIASGFPIKYDDTPVYSWILYPIQIINPTYYGLPLLFRTALAGTGECIVQSATITTGPGSCEVTLGDVALENMRLDEIDTHIGFAVLLFMFGVSKGMQCGFMFGNLYWDWVVGVLKRYGLFKVFNVNVFRRRKID
ncbi:hypothetical protein HK102_001268 [Quaeritorhiza haematococci]|nr:hypothetical protein HK102_001268 [Quaeritorhiza haematococci]